MTFNEIQAANATIQTTNIKGKEYAEVNQRIKAFRMLYPEGTIKTELLRDEDSKCIVRAEIWAGETLLGTGIAFEIQQSSYINKTSYIENCETSAVGRALAMCGLGIDTSVASKEEVENAIAQQEATKKKTDAERMADAYPPEKEMIAFIKENYDAENLAKMLDYYGVERVEDMTMTQIVVAYNKKAGK